MTTSDSSPHDQANLPVHRESFGAVACAIWRNETAEGEAFYAATFSRTYRYPETGDWRDSQAFGARDLLAVSHVAERAAQQIETLTRADRRQAARPEAELTNGEASGSNGDHAASGRTADRQRTR